MLRIESEKQRKNKSFWNRDNRKKKKPKQGNFPIAETGKM